MSTRLDTQTITAVIFDCDGVLIDSEVLSLEIERSLLAEIGLAYELAEYKRRFLGLPFGTYLDAIKADALERTGRALPDGLDIRFGALLNKAFEEKLRAISGAHELVHALDLPKAVASSSKLKSLERKLTMTGLKPAFGTHIYSTELVARGKPAPDLFLLAAERIGAAAPTTLVVEDSANGIRAAKAAGMIAAGFTGGGHCDAGHDEMLISAGADMVFASFAAIESHLANAIR